MSAGGGLPFEWQKQKEKEAAEVKALCSRSWDPEQLVDERAFNVIYGREGLLESVDCLACETATPFRVIESARGRSIFQLFLDHCKGKRHRKKVNRKYGAAPAQQAVGNVRYLRPQGHHDPPSKKRVPPPGAPHRTPAPPRYPRTYQIFRHCSWWWWCWCCWCCSTLHPQRTAHCGGGKI